MTSHGGGPEITPGLHRVPWGGNRDPQPGLHHEPHQHRASCDDAGGNRICGQLNAYEQAQLDEVEDEDPVAIKKLHPMQWVTYIVVNITCVLLLYALLEAYLFIGRVQDVLSKLGEAFNNNLGVF
jgi:hypothetical protein